MNVLLTVLSLQPHVCTTSSGLTFDQNALLVLFVSESQGGNSSGFTDTSWALVHNLEVRASLTITTVLTTSVL